MSLGKEKKDCSPMLAFAGMFTAFVLLVSAPLLMLSSAFAQGSEDSSSANLNTGTSYSSSYPIETADAIHPLTLATEHHLSYPGDMVRVQGALWTEVVKKVQNLTIIRVELKDGAGNVVAREDANASAGNGEYSASLKLLDSAARGTYTVSANAQVDADALGIIKTITSAALQSSMQIAVATQEEHKVNAENQNFTVTIASNSGITDFKFSEQDKKVSFLVEGDAGTIGISEVTIPKRLLSGNMSLFYDQNLMAKDDVLLKSDNETATTFEVNYHHSIHRIEVAGTSVVPEFPLPILAAIMGIASVIAYSSVKGRR